MKTLQNAQYQDPPIQEDLAAILKSCQRIAIVGLSPKEARDSNRVARYLLKQGYEIVPVNPGQKKILGRPCYPSLAAIPFQVNMANLFLNPSRVPPVVDQAIALGLQVLWMQLGVVHEAAARKARQAGIRVVMDRCIMEEHKKISRCTPDSPFPPI
ncbi:MAG: CoA-binding protein [Deltaproteobacteria bacterium]|jgi:predicted CoA-binding protein